VGRLIGWTTCIIWKESLNSDGQQFQQNDNHLSLKLTEYKKTMTYDVGNPGFGLGQTQTCGWIILVNEIPSKN
jgi:hypothetical protein